MFFQRVKTKGLGHNAYLLGCGEGQAVVIDPRRDISEYLQIARDNNLSIACIFETHRQEDFEFGSRALADATGAKIVTGCHPLFGESDVKLADEQEFKVGTTRFVALETPGHTPESMCYAVYPSDTGDKCWGVFTGDTLFVGDTGRTDLSDEDKTAENAGILYDSVHRKLPPLGDQALVLPAHGAGSACGGNISDRDDTTLGIEKKTNKVFTKSRKEFVDAKLEEKLPRPPYFRHMEEVNLHGGRPLQMAPEQLEVLQPRQLQQRMKEGLLIDTRSPEAFAGAHIAGAYNIWLDGMSSFGGWMANHKTRIFLIVEQPEHTQQAVKALARIGIDSVAGVMLKGVEKWREEGLPIDHFATTSAQQCAEWLQAGKVEVLDMRDDMEWEEKHIPGAMHTFVGYLEEQPPKLPKDTPIVVHCSVGHRSALACSILKRQGFSRIHNMLGGLTAWENLDLPLEKKSS
ncbi:MBL fold metallo-hydrolase [Piscinibacter sakaiensis]|uniref:MBL fold metallo-hydrolase n=1 Tax=Piscinibacter sakaiensis TaxID=1547922 RepID=UPI003AAB46DF